jgi:hypothetical protein
MPHLASRWRQWAGTCAVSRSVSLRRTPARRPAPQGAAASFAGRLERHRRASPGRDRDGEGGSRIHGPSDARILAFCGETGPQFWAPLPAITRGNPLRQVQLLKTKDRIWRRGWDSDPTGPCSSCNLQILQCHPCRECQRCRGALHAIARTAQVRGARSGTASRDKAEQAGHCPRRLRYRTAVLFEVESAVFAFPGRGEPPPPDRAIEFLVATAVQNATRRAAVT